MYGMKLADGSVDVELLESARDAVSTANIALQPGRLDGLTADVARQRDVILQQFLEVSLLRHHLLLPVL